jgi:hypothetical protein
LISPLYCDGVWDFTIQKEHLTYMKSSNLTSDWALKLTNDYNITLYEPAVNEIKPLKDYLVHTDTGKWIDLYEWWPKEGIKLSIVIREIP